MGLFDVHAHLTHPDLAPLESEIVASARAAGVTSIVVNGLNPTDNAAVAALAKRHPDLIRPAFGFYPVDTVLARMEELGIDYPRDIPPVSPDEGVAWVRDHVQDAFAVGEIGLDGYWVPEALWEEQEAVFRRLVAIALEADKAIIIHTRKRERRALEILDEMKVTRVDWHCFGGRVKLARAIVEREGHYLSIPSNARRNEAFTRMIETLPRDRLLLETDCPYLGPEPGVRSEPSCVAGTAAFMAQCWGASAEQVRVQLEDNYERLFRVRP